MKRHEVAALYEMRLRDLARRKEHLARQRQQFVTDVYRIRTHPGADAHTRRAMLAQHLKGRSYKDWMDYFDDYAASFDDEMHDYQEQLHAYSRPVRNPWVVPAAMLLLVGIVALGITYRGPALTSFTVASLPHTPAAATAPPVNQTNATAPPPAPAQHSQQPQPQSRG